MVQSSNLMPLLIVTGPTAVGKSSLALRLAEKLNTEIISADSMQVYQGLNIGTAKPSIQEQQKIKHHLIDVLPPDADCSSFVFKQMTQKVLDDFAERGLVPLIVGGTGFYLRHLLFDFDFDNGKKDLAVRSKLTEILNQPDGKQKLFKTLKQIDPKTAECLHENDINRVMRALEIFYTTGIKKSAGKSDFKQKHPHIIFVLDLPRPLLYQKINLRVDEMMRQGLLEEAEGIFKSISVDAQSLKAIGYKELVKYFERLCTLDEAVETIKKNTRNYAKRQLTYFRGMQNTVWLNAQTPQKELEKKVVDLYFSTFNIK